MADTIIENLVTKLTFAYDPKKLRQFGKGVDNAIGSLKNMILASSVAQKAVAFISSASIVGLALFTKKVAESTDTLGKFAQRIGVSLDLIQELGYAAEANGASVETMNSTLESLSRIIGEASLGAGSGVEAFGRLGISVTDSAGKLKAADQVFIELADAIAQVDSQAQKLELISKLGISPALLLALEQGSDALRRQTEEARSLGFVLGKDATKAAADFNDAMLKLDRIVTGTAKVIGSRLHKQVTPVINAFVRWYLINKQIIQQNVFRIFEQAVNTFKAMFNIGTRAFNVIDRIATAFGGWENAVKLATGAVIALNASVLTLPIAIAAAAVALFLIIEDFQKFSAEGDSAIGALTEKFPYLEAPVRGLISLLRMVAEGWRLIFTQGGEALEGLILMARDAAAWIKDLSNTVVEAGRNIVDFLLKPVEGVFDKLSKIPGAEFFAGRANVNTGVATAGAAPTNVINNTRNSNPNINVNIYGGAPAEVRREIQNVLNETYAGSVTNLESEVAY